MREFIVRKIGRFWFRGLALEFVDRINRRTLFTVFQEKIFDRLSSLLDLV